MKMDSERFWIDELLNSMTREAEASTQQSQSEIDSKPKEGRYPGIGEELSVYFSDIGFTQNKVLVEIEWLKYLLYKLPDLDISYNAIVDDSDDFFEKIDNIYENMNLSDYQTIKELEKNHTNAIQIFISDKLKGLNLEKLSNLIHFGCTDEDVTNIANACMIGDSIQYFFIPTVEKLVLKMAQIAKKHMYTAMFLYRDNNMPVQTTIGKELMVYVYRVYYSTMNILNNKPTAKFSGSAGNYLELMAAFPEVDWIRLCHDFIEERMELKYISVVSEYETYDFATDLVDRLRKFNNILREFNSIMQFYCMKNYLVKARTKYTKVDIKIFEECQNMLQKSNQICMNFSNEFSQCRSITDIGVAIEYSLQAVKETMNNFRKISVNMETLGKEMVGHWEVLVEPINTAFAVHGIKDAFSKLQESVGDKKITGEDVRKFISSSDVLKDEQKTFLLSLTPTSYIGYAAGITGGVYRQLISMEGESEY